MVKKILTNYLYNMIYQILIMILPLITTPYISRVLRANSIGAYSYTQSITYYFVLFGCFGLNLYGQREVAYVQDDKAKRSKVFWEMMSIRLITHILSFLIFSITFIHHEKYALLFTIQILDIVASFFDISWFFQGLEDFKRIVMKNIFVKLGAVICIFIFVKSPLDIYLYALIYSLSLFIGNIIMILYLPRLIIRVNIKELELKKHLRPSIVLFLPQIASSIYNVLDKTMIGTLTKMEEEIAYYEQAQKIVKVALSFLTSIGTVMLPRIASIYVQKDLNTIYIYIQKSFMFTFFLGVPLTFGMISIADGLVPWFYGDGFEKVAPNIIIIAPIILIVGLSNVLGIQYLLPTEKQNMYFISVLSGALINVLLNIIFIPKLYSLGAAIASVIAELSVLIIQIIITRKFFDFICIIKNAFKYIVSGIIMFLTLGVLARFLSPGIKASIIQIAIGGCVYFGMLIVLKDEILLKIIKRQKENNI